MVARLASRLNEPSLSYFDNDSVIFLQYCSELRQEQEMILQTSSPTEVFKKCVAVTIATNTQEAEDLGRLATALGFSAAVDLPHSAKIATDTLSFYFVHHRVPDAAKMRFLSLVRALSEENRRYAPIVLLLPSGPKHLSIQYIEMGFDEVLFLNDPTNFIADKLAAQLGQELLYVQTKHYLGPDRRRVELIDRQDPRRKKSGGEHREIAVFRDVESGIRTEPRH
jgi:hypothetical protein